ncbi:MAG: hypothetical protein AAF539_11590 [Planctomycetota bacterium]
MNPSGLTDSSAHAAANPSKRIVAWRPLEDVFKRLSGQRSLVAAALFNAAMLVTVVGCESPSATVIEETDEYSFDDVTAQLEAEEIASMEAREE